jgi:hypothetical protein
MISQTEVKDHWILEGDFSNNQELSYDYQVILNLLESKIEHIANREIAFDVHNTFYHYGQDDKLFFVPNVFNKPLFNYKDYISKTQNWIGYINEISETEFSATLVDKNDPTTYELAQFDMNEVSNGDLGLLKLGAIFYWSVGIAHQNGQIIKQSLIRFKRSVELTVEEFDEIIDKADELSNTIIWE